MTDFNYIDAFEQSSAYEFQLKQNDTAIQLQGRNTFIFPLAKDSTVKSEIYQEATDARIYLPCFQQRALYNTMDFLGNINTNLFQETEDTMEFEYNLERTVVNIRDLKQQKSGTLIITNKSNEILKCVIENKIFKLFSITGVELVSKNLTDFSAVNLFINSVNKDCSLIYLSYNGNTEKAENICSINTKLFPNRKFTVEVENNLYKECSDIIEAGYVIVVDNGSRAYQVTNVYPANNFINKYISLKCKCKLTDMALLNLPNNWRSVISRNKHSLPKINQE